MRKQNNKFKKAFGLIEVLIALVLVSTTMILAINTVSRGLQISKENEIVDSASGLLLQGLEYRQLDLPPEVMADLSNQRPIIKHCYKLDRRPNDETKIFIEEVHSGCDPETVIDQCGASYRMWNNDQFEVCNQIMFTNLDQLNGQLNPLSDRIRIVSTVVYFLDGETVSDSLVTYKRL